ncbi:MAG: hypothetical protein ACXVCP_08090 [Bdellovibrio sp.]
MKIVLLFIFEFIIFGTFSAQAATSSCEPIFHNIEQKYYVDGMCPDNTFYFFKKFKEAYPKEDFSASKVLFIFPRWTGSNQYHFRTSKFKAGYKLWHFHVVLLHKNYIYDSELKNEAISVADFFKQEFGADFKTEHGHKNYIETIEKVFSNDYDDDPPEADSKFVMHVRPIPAETFLKEYSFKRSLSDPKEKNYAYWIHGDPRFPDQTLEKFLEGSN